LVNLKIRDVSELKTNDYKKKKRIPGTMFRKYYVLSKRDFVCVRRLSTINQIRRFEVIRDDMY